VGVPRRLLVPNSEERWLRRGDAGGCKLGETQAERLETGAGKRILGTVLISAEGGHSKPNKTCSW